MQNRRISLDSTQPFKIKKVSHYLTMYSNPFYTPTCYIILTTCIFVVAYTNYLKTFNFFVSYNYRVNFSQLQNRMFTLFAINHIFTHKTSALSIKQLNQNNVCLCIWSKNRILFRLAEWCSTFVWLAEGFRFASSILPLEFFIFSYSPVH